MYLLTYLTALLLANVVSASAIHPRDDTVLKCAEQVPSAEFQKASRTLLATASNSSLTRRQQGYLTFQVFAHVVYADRTARGGYVRETLVREQMKTINKHYSPVGISFNLVKTTYTQNSNWASGNDEAGMKRRLRQGGYSDLNLYYTANIPDPQTGKPVLGLCYFPVNHRPSEQEMETDGCMVTAQTVPGSDPWTGHDMATTHEIGHWLGLLHTFEPTCRIGDLVDDTFPQEQPTGHCIDDLVFACGGWQQTASQRR
ncbi:metalloprotease 1 [Metarhizium rileyi]|uniref:Metalloprotease 1 n=1 Tax=Metarhizium rileyi (strain RCEF 4871) TaxID=1649241 RepID=A0A167JII4_METRR|nr:metalloprotease 1 [Metarhizium rileyi RCEF 4871]